MPILNYANPLHTFSSGNLSYTTTKECWLVGTAFCSAHISNFITIDGNVYGGSENHQQGADWVTTGSSVMLHLKAGSTVSVNYESTTLHVLEEV